MKYASHTLVSVDRSRSEIERLLTRYGASSFASGWQGSQAVIGFVMCERRIKFILPLPDKGAKAFTHTAARGSRRTEEEAYRHWEQACRQRWRALALVVKAKLEAVETGITTFEEEFLAHIVLPDGKTVAEHSLAQIATAYKSGKVPLLLGGF